MYNRYIPQPDGTFRKCRQPDQARRQDHPKPKPHPASKNPPETEQVQHSHKPQPAINPSQPGLGFLRQLLPKDFDTGDLIVILLLLLMAGDNEESRSNAILTIALYILM
ncbi:MAG: hypothetical protein E7437_03025 [Ruminococcaceae bacterium]|nr:hypothetical protein [Oscillospiraceae bacterium]